MVLNMVLNRVLKNVQNLAFEFLQFLQFLQFGASLVSFRSHVPYSFSEFFISFKSLKISKSFSWVPTHSNPKSSGMSSLMPYLTSYEV